jgi:L-rhamnose isomerase
MKNIEQLFENAKSQYAEIGVDAGKAVEQLNRTPISLHCWQADDVGGFERESALLGGGGIQATGNYPGKPRNIEQTRNDLEKAYSLIPGSHRLNLHALYGDFQGRFPGRDQIEPKHFRSWVDWAKENKLGLDFNSTFFSHPKADDGFTLTHRDKSIRDFWIEHGRRCREISHFIGGELGKRCVHNIWIPDGSKDVTVNRHFHRSLLKESLDRMLEKPFPARTMRDSVESKLFGIGSEAFVVGSHEFYLGYAIQKGVMLCMDIGHYHPTESCADKISAVFQFVDELLLHVTRGVRWDSDHVVILNDSVKELMQEIVWADRLQNVCIGLDFFDASINRIGAYVIGTRATQKALLLALLDPIQKLREYEQSGRGFERLALLEEAKSKPFGAVWDYYCFKNDVPVGEAYIAEIQNYEKEVLKNRI